jgi:hypothetical protein
MLCYIITFSVDDTGHTPRDFLKRKTGVSIENTMHGTRRRGSAEGALGEFLGKEALRTGKRWHS